MRIDVYPTTTIGFRPTLTAVGAYLAARGIVPSASVFCETVLAREQLGSTSIGAGLMVPHYMAAGFTPARLVLVPIHADASWAGLDGEPIQQLLITCFDPAMPQPAFRDLLRALADPNNGARLIQTPDAELAAVAAKMMKMEDNNGLN